MTQAAGSPYKALPTESKIAQRKEFVEHLLKITSGVVIYLDDPAGECTKYITNNPDLLRHITYHSIHNNLMIFAVNREANKDFIHTVEYNSCDRIIPFVGDLRELLEMNGFAYGDFGNVNLLWYDNDKTPDAKYMKCSMQDILNHLLQNEYFGERATLLVTYSLRRKGKERTRFHNSLKEDVKKSIYRTRGVGKSLAKKTVLYRGKAFEDGKKSGAGPMCYEKFVFEKKAL